MTAMTADEMRELDAEIAVVVFGWEWMERLHNDDKHRRAIFPPSSWNWVRFNYDPMAWRPASPMTPKFSDWDKACAERDDDRKKALLNKRQWGLPHYTTDPAAAFALLQKCAEKANPICLGKTDRGHLVYSSIEQATLAPTLEQAIAKFARNLFAQEKDEV